MSQTKTTTTTTTTTKSISTTAPTTTKTSTVGFFAQRNVVSLTESISDHHDKISGSKVVSVEQVSRTGKFSLETDPQACTTLNIVLLSSRPSDAFETDVHVQPYNVISTICSCIGKSSSRQCRDSRDNVPSIPFINQTLLTKLL
jgi:hypothetical protein